jgi:aminopeptidase N
MKRICFVVFISLVAVACGRNVPAVVEGVSLELALYREAVVSDVRYDIEFYLPETPQERVTGKETISFQLACKSGLQIDFRADSGAVKFLIINGKPLQPDIRAEHIVLPASALHKGTNAVEIEFVSGDRSLNRSGEFMYSLFVPDRARTVFPCFDQPGLKGRFSLTLDLPASWEAVANGSAQTCEAAGSRKKITFNETQPLPTYLFSFTAGLWKKETRERGGEPITVYFRESDPAKTAQLDDIFQTVFASLDWMEAYTGIKRPFEKYDFVIVPGFQFGGMEHPGAILYNERLMFLGPTPTTAERLRRTELIAHETSHLWFGDAVTMRWFNDVWTKEVFANYFAAQIAAPLYPEVNITLREFRGFNIPAYAEDRTAGTNAIRRPLDNLSNAGLIYGNIVYDKAPVVMRMLADMLGPEAFRDGMREYLNKYLYSNADWNDLITMLDSHTDADLKQWSRVWVEEAGMPEIGCSTEDGKLMVIQQDPLGRNLTWPQKISISDTAGNPVDTIWLKDASFVKNRQGGYSAPLLPNLDALSYGYFRLDGDAADAALGILPSLEAPQARISLLATLYENVLHGQIEAARFLNATTSLLAGEHDPLVAAAAVAYLGDLSKHGPLAGSAEIETVLFYIAGNKNVSDDIRLTALRSLFGTFRRDMTARILWNTFVKGDGFEGLDMGVRDWMSLAYELAERLPERYGDIEEIMTSRIDNPDLLREFRFIWPATSPDNSVRDSVFTALLSAENRAVEPWAESALAYLNHPLRAAEAVGYITPALEELQEVQRTGDIFFPKNWAGALLDGHDSPEAAAAVREFIASHPDYPPLLKTKLLQAADHLLR